MVVEKLKEREDARDAKQDEENLLAEIERLKSVNSELVHENDHLQLSLQNAQQAYLLEVKNWEKLQERIDKLEEAFWTIINYIRDFTNELLTKRWSENQ